jgi:hypothetical protein
MGSIPVPLVLSSVAVRSALRENMYQGDAVGLIAEPRGRGGVKGELFNFFGRVFVE